MISFRSGRGREGKLVDVKALAGVSLFDYVNGLVTEHGAGPLPNGGEQLPDEPPPDPSKVRFGAGSLDGIQAVRTKTGGAQDVVVAAAATLDLLRRAPTTG